MVPVKPPWAEEFLFRGLTFRAMLAQCGFWPSLLLSTAFFTLLHPMMSWPMVFLLGASSAWLFVRTRTLLPCATFYLQHDRNRGGLTRRGFYGGATPTNAARFA